MLRLSRGFCLIVAALVSACRPTALPHTIAQGSSPDPRPNDGEWIAYGRDAFGGRFSPLTQIDRTNVGRLTMAWTYRTGEMEERFATPRETSFEATPLMVDGTLYLSTPLGRVIALDPSTGTERWVFDPQVPRNVRFGDFANRGVSTWVDRRVSSGSPCARRIYVATIDARLAAVDARTGAPCADFGVGGIVNLRSGLHNAPSETAEYEMTSPPAVIGDLLVVGSSVADNNRTDAASGEVRALDARTGALRWSWDPVPRDSADAAWRTWTGPSAHRTGAANAWSVIAADAARDLVFVPTSSPSPDYFGGERLGDNRYANSIVALRASTGRVVWSFQTVHHDVWDYDNASPPALVTITKNGRRVDAVLQATKTGQLFVLDRDTGAPLFPVEERSVPTSTVPGEHASPTQPFNTVIPPLSPQRFSLDSVWGATPSDREACRQAIAGLRNDGVFTPPSFEGSFVLPSNIGGAHWGGVAFDPVREIAIVPVNRLAAEVQLIPAEKLDVNEQRANSRLGYEYTRMRGTPYVMRRRLLISPNRLPCTPPPFGSLVAVSLRDGHKLWDVPLGTLPLPEGATVTSGNLGAPNLGGAIATAGGVVFVAATLDRMFRAFDIETGRELWRTQLPAGGRATPMTFQLGADGKQYVVIAAGGGNEFGRGDFLIAYSLP